MKELVCTVRMGDLGRVVIPKAIRYELNIGKGSLVKISLSREDVTERLANPEEE